MDREIDWEKLNSCRRRKPRGPSPLFYIIFVIIAAAIIGAAVWGVNAFLNRDPPVELTLELNGSTEIILEYGESFEDEGARILANGEAVEGELTVSGEADPTKLGTYTITYTALYEGQTATIQRQVTIADTQPPEITLEHLTGYFTEPGKDYEEEGFSAQDNYDGDLTEAVQRTVEGDTVTYTVTDSSGNTATAQRQIIYGDATAPVLELSGDETVTIDAGTAFTDPGYTATDNVDGDITANVTVSGDYDIYVPGTYTITYSVTDTCGNTAEAVRTLIVEALSQPEVVDPGEKVIYLTFDDGPSSYTPKLLEVLKQYNVKATFFVVGTSAIEHLDDIAAGGHSIGIHSNTHDFSDIYTSEDAYFADLNALREKIYDRTGIYTTLVRFPGGSSNTVSGNYCEGIMTQLSQALTDMGYQYFDWNVDSKDAGGAKTADEVFQNVINGVQNHDFSIVLQHDIKQFSVEAVEQIIQWGLANGYTFLPLDSTSPTVHHRINN